MEMPKSCAECPLFHLYLDINGTIHFICKYGYKEMYGDLKNKRNDLCSLLEQEPILDKIRAEIEEWYWQTDKQALTKDPCIVDTMVDLFIRMIDKYKTESEDEK